MVVVMMMMMMVGVGSCRWMVGRANDDSRIPKKVEEENACTGRVCGVGSGRDVEFWRRYTMAAQSG